MVWKPILIAAFSLGLAQAAAADDWEDCLKGSPPSAVNKGCTAVLADPATPADKRITAYINRSKSWLWPNRAKGIEDAARAIELNPARPAAYAARCEASVENAEKLPDLEAALPDCNRAIELNPKDPSGYLARSRYYTRLSYYYGHQDDIERAAADRQRAGEFVPHDDYYYQQEGTWLHVYKHDNNGAIAAFTKAIELNKNNASAYWRRANCYSDTSELEKAIEDFTRALEIDPEILDAHVLRGKIYLAKHQYDLAIQDFSLELRHPQKNYIYGNPYTLRAVAYMKKGSYSQAIGDREAAFRAEPSEYTLYALAMAYNANGEFDKALALHKRAPMEYQEYLAMASTHRNMGAYTLAMADYDGALKQVDIDDDAFYGRGVTLFIMGEFTEAVADFSQAEQRANEFNKKNFNKSQLPIVKRGVQSHAIIFGYLAQLKLGDAQAAEFEAKAGQLQIAKWPKPVLDLYLGKTGPEAVLAAATTHDSRCEAHFYTGEWYLLHSSLKEAEASFALMASGCNKGTAEYAVAQAELKKLRH